MNVWWCEEHMGSSYLNLQPERGCWKSNLGISNQNSCRMVEIISQEDRAAP